jgi:hypothetical protein
MRTILAAVLSLAALACLSAPSKGETPQEAFDSLYGADIKRVAASADMKDDVALAGEMLKTVQSGDAKPEILLLLCNKAYELAMKDTTGYETAASVMKELGSRMPEKKAYSQEKVADAMQKQFQATPVGLRPVVGEELLDLLLAMAADKATAKDYAEAAKIMDRAISVSASFGSNRIGQLRERQKVYASLDANSRQMAVLQAKLKESPADNVTRAELVRLCLVEMDNPSDARKFLGDNASDTQRTYVPLACSEPAKLTDQSCLDMGEWYRGLTDTASASAKPAMLKRAKTYYETFLTKHPADDVDRNKATLALKKVDEALAALEGGGGSWVDVLKVIAPSLTDPNRPWVMAGSALKAKTGRGGRMDIPMAVDGSYEVMIRLVRNDGDDVVAVTLPVGDGSVTVILSEQKGNYSGLGQIAGKSADNNGQTIKPGKLVNGEPYLLHVLVMLQGKNAEITVDINGQKAMHYSGPQDALTAERGWRPNNAKNLSLGFRRSGYTFETFRLRMISGNLVQAGNAQTRPASQSQPQDTPPVRPPVGPPPPPPPLPRIPPVHGHGH